jgi:hypothetical protein
MFSAAMPSVVVSAAPMVPPTVPEAPLLTKTEALRGAETGHRDFTGDFREPRR